MSQNKFTPQNISFQIEGKTKVELSLDENGKLNLISENASIEIIKILDNAFKQIHNISKYGFDSLNKKD